MKPTKLKSALDRYEQQQSRNLQIIGMGAGVESNWSHNYNFEPVPARHSKPKYNNRNMSLHHDQTTSIENDEKSERNAIG